MEGAVEAGLEVSQQRVDPAELRQIAGVLPTSDDGLMAAARSGDGTEAGQASESTWLPGARCSLAQAPIASELKPFTAVILA